MQKRGYFFPAGDPLPDVPKRITKASVRRLKDIQKNIYKKARWIDPITGNETSGVRGQDIEAERRGKKAAETRKRRQDEEGGEPPTYTMYDRIRQELEERRTWTYTRKNIGEKSVVIRVDFDDEVADALRILKQNFATDPNGYEAYLSAMEGEIMDALEKSEILADFTSDITSINRAYQTLINLLNGAPVDTPGEIQTDEEGFIVGDYDVPFY